MQQDYLTCKMEKHRIHERKGNGRSRIRMSTRGSQLNLVHVRPIDMYLPIHQFRKKKDICHVHGRLDIISIYVHYKVACPRSADLCRLRCAYIFGKEASATRICMLELDVLELGLMIGVHRSANRLKEEYFIWWQAKRPDTNMT